MSTCFVDETATPEILLRVTNVCSECYGDLEVGDAIHYDLQNYRYICGDCHQVLCEKMNDECEVVEGDGLF